MPNRVGKEHRSWNMSRIRGRDTSPELLVRSLLHRHGFRFRLHASNLPGRPDVVLPKYRTVVFVNGCFWHNHTGCKRAKLPRTGRVFWKAKIEGNRRRDRLVTNQLRQLGWRVVVVWQCELSAGKAPTQLTELLEVRRGPSPRVLTRIVKSRRGANF